MPTLDWIGQKAVINHHRQVPYHLLRCAASYMLVIQEHDEEQKEYDYTLVPLRAKTAVRYT